MIIRDVTPDDFDEVWRIRRRAFGGPVLPGPSWPGDLSTWRGFVADSGDGLCGFLRIRRLGQFFGGRVVPMGGLASVAVDPHARGRGVASGLVDAALHAMRADGQPLSALFTRVPALYRGRGWERAGVVEHADLDLTALRGLPGGKYALRPLAGFDVQECYRALAIDGMLERRDFLLRGDPELGSVALDSDGGVRGYVDLSRVDSRLDVHDLVALDSEAAVVLLRSLASWSGLIDRVRIRSAEPEVLALLLPDGLPSPETEPWYLRVVDFPAAVAARGWPAARLLAEGTQTCVEIVDEHAPWHAGTHRLVVEGGTVHSERTSRRADLRLHTRALGPWFSGAASTSTLIRAGLCTGDGSVLDALVSRGTPRMLDSF
ncbi:spore coat protein [Amycolatopsis bartoniae]|uniref:Spore coat protein n=1 Tax=Amycolatopsis bartoniae TaxID=941986 RepID=A0A8H9J3F4_9PSEU|nr:spore coat protein [Amycolatopsis bartoniae]